MAGVLVVDDYAHHPEEVRATLRAAREGFDRRIVALFQPHRYSRTRDLFEAFLSAFDEADIVVLTEIYGAGEEATVDVSAEKLYEALKRRGHAEVHLVPKRGDMALAVLPLIETGDMILTLGAGDIFSTAGDLLKVLRERDEP